MTPTEFLTARRAVWERVDTLLGRCGRRGVNALTPAEVRELAGLYPALAVDVSRCRLHQLDPATQQRVNRLAIAAHGLLYRRPARRPFEALWNFFRRDYPRLFRARWAYTALAAAIFLAAALGAYAGTRLRPAIAYVFVPVGLEMPDGSGGVTVEDISERFRQMPNAPLATGIMVNNISVAFNAFAFGITAGLGTCYVLLENGIMLGAFAAHFTNHRLQFELWSFIAPHGILEITAILIAAAAGLRMGLALALPGPLTRRASLRAGARDAAFLVLGTIPLFIVAGLIEGFVTPAHLPGALKIALGLSVEIATLWWLTMAGRRSEVKG